MKDYFLGGVPIFRISEPPIDLELLQFVSCQNLSMY